MSLPLHISHKLQFLDLMLFSCLYNGLPLYELYITSTGHDKIAEYDPTELLNKAFTKVASMDKAVSDKFNEDEFAYDQELR